MKRWDVTAITGDRSNVTVVEADSMEVDYYGTLIFYRQDEVSNPVIVRAFAHGGWTEVEKVTR